MRQLARGPRTRHRVDRGLLIACLGIAIGLVAIGFAFLTADDGADDALPDGIEEISPPPSAPQVPSQSQIIVDLADGLIGELTVDGLTLDTIRLDEIGQLNVKPGAQVDVPFGAVYEPGNATLTFTPTPDSDLERFDSGVHRVTLVYWSIEDGRSAAAPSYSWTFTSV